jgi:glycosyltransferase involved in cell wall biosynthesis
MPYTIDILLATYNGGKYLREQLDSIIDQSNVNWRLIIRDDGSSDDTIAIINEYQKHWPGRISLLNSNGKALGAVGNFSLLLESSTADYVMLCDQDDVWLPDKIDSTLEKIRSLENDYGHDTPLLVYTDLCVVDEKLLPVADSMWRYQQLNPFNGSRLNRLLLHNIPTGCTMMINRRLRELASPVPAEACMHDWWISLVAAAFGKSDIIFEPTVRYRQHDSNFVGAEPWSLPREICRFLDASRRLERIDKRERLLSKYRAQASAFLIRYGVSLPVEVRTMVEIFANLDKYGILMQKYYIMKYRFFYSSPVMTTGMILFRW